VQAALGAAPVGAATERGRDVEAPHGDVALRVAAELFDGLDAEGVVVEEAIDRRAETISSSLLVVRRKRDFSL
jgi:hypothetical protein